MDVVWLKRDVRLHDHAPLQAACHQSNNNTPICVLYLYEPDQLSQPAVHGSHIAVTNEGLVDMDQQLCGCGPDQQQQAITQQQATSDDVHEYQFRYLTVCYANAIPTLQYIHSNYTIKRLLAHEETGHYASYQRDRQVRKWCKEHSVPFQEFVQSGVTRRLQNRDDFSKKLKHFLEQPQCTVDVVNLRTRIRQLTMPRDNDIDNAGSINNNSVIRFNKKPLMLDQIIEIPLHHRVDRASRQKGGERAAQRTLHSFLHERGKRYSAGISSPLSSWTSCSRLSVFLSWGHISLRHVHQATQQRSQALKNLPDTGTSKKSLAAFQSRLHWRAHFIQKLESDPLLEKRDLHPSYQRLRRQPQDWNEAHYQAWATGITGFPFVDACMRCLLQTGWLNFRMRAMLVSFATYNLWLDWKRIAPHLARVFLDYEPGIHYPQLQMQAGTTGINAMRVYNVIKQGKDQDPDGVFVKRYVRELQRVPKQYIHEPWKMTSAMQQKYHVWISKTAAAKDETKGRYNNNSDVAIDFYPIKIVDEQETARTAKAKVNDIRKQESAKEIAQQVYEKHGSRTRRDDMPKKRKAPPKNQPGIEAFFSKPIVGANPQPKVAATTINSNNNKKPKQPIDANPQLMATTITNSNNKKPKQRSEGQTKLPFATSDKGEKKQTSVVASGRSNSGQTTTSSSWACNACTFLNENALGLACSICGTQRGARAVG